MRMFKKEEGFTLVELMVVVLIIGILVAIAIPVFNAATESARKSACQNNLRVLDGAVEQWVAADPDNDKSLLVSVTVAEEYLAETNPAVTASTSNPAMSVGQYVKDWAGSTVCPADSTITYEVLAGSPGDFRCFYVKDADPQVPGTASEHNYDE